MPIHDRLKSVEEGLAEGDTHGPAVTVEWADARPETRPEGMAWEPDEHRLTFDFWHAQRAALDALDDPGNDIVAFLAGYRSGKSIAGARWLITQALRHPGERFLAMGVDYSRAVSTTHKILFEQLPGERTAIVTSSFSGPESSPVVADHNRGEHRLTLTNDSEILLGSADSWSRYLGAEFAGVWCDEAALYDDLHRVNDAIGSRLTADAGPKVQFWTTTGQGYTDAWEILEQRENEDGEPLALEIEVVRASVTENPYLSDEDIKRLKRQFAHTGKAGQALHGEFQQASGLVYSNFDRQTHVIPHAEAVDRVDGSQPRIYAYDAGWNDPRVVLEAGPTAFGQFVVLDEFYEREAPVEDAIAWLRQREQIDTEAERQRPKGVVWCEHEPSDVERMKRHAIDARNAEKSIDAGISAVRARFDTDEQDRPGLLISDKCTNLIHELQSYQREQVGTSGAQDHAADCLRYLIASEERRGGRLSTGVYPHDFIVGEREYL